MEQKEERNPFNDLDLSIFEETSKYMEGLSIEEEENKSLTEKENNNNEEIIDRQNQEQEEEAEENKEEPSSQDIKESPFVPFAKLLVEEGVLPDFKEEEWDGSAEGLIEAVDTKAKKLFEEYKTQTLHPKLKWLQDNYEEGIPLRDLLEIDERRTDFAKITEESLESDVVLQKEIARQYYQETTSFSKERINKAVEMLENTDELKEESKTFFKELKELNNKKEQELIINARKERDNLAKQQQQILDNFKSTLTKTEQIIPGIRLNNIIRDKIYNTLTTVVEIDESSGTPLNKITKAKIEDPIGFEIKLAYLFEITDGFKNWSSILAGGKKEAYKSFEEAANNLDRKRESNDKIFTNNSTKEILNELDFVYKQNNAY